MTQKAHKLEDVFGTPMQFRFTRGLLRYAPLLVVAAFSLAIKLYDPLRSPVLGTLDPWGWTAWAREFLSTGTVNPYFQKTGYTPTFMYLIAMVAVLFHSDAYDAVRFIPVLSALNVIPIYLLAFEIFHSRKVSALASVLAITSRYNFMRTSAGVPESFAQFFFTFSLLFMLKAFSQPTWRRRLCAGTFITISVLYYHFTILLLVPFLVVLPFAFWSRRKAITKEMAILIVPPFLLCGVIWFFPLLPNMIHYYLGTTVATYARPTFENSLRGLLDVLAYSVAKSGVVGLSEMGYILAAFAFLGMMYWARRRFKENGAVGVPFIATYLFVLVAAVLISRIVYELGVAGAGDSSVYVFSWLTIPASIFAAYIVFLGLGQIIEGLQTRIVLRDISRFAKVAAICTIILLGMVNLNSLNYYKAPAGGWPIPDSFYYYKPMTDQTYYALKYIHDNTPSNSVILVVGVTGFILNDQAEVTNRTMIGISNLTIVNQDIKISGEIRFSNLSTANFTLGTIAPTNAQGQPVYVVTGIRYLTVEMAREHGMPPEIDVQNEQLLVSQLTNSTSVSPFYQNDQITIVQIHSVQITY